MRRTARGAGTPVKPAGTLTGRRVAVLTAALAALLVVCVLSIAIGENLIGPAAVLRGLFAPPGSIEHNIVWASRVPRTVVGLVVGLALALAGGVIQALTRNPLADPGILGVNAGAAFVVAIGIAVLGVDRPIGYVWFALVGAAVTTVAVYAIGGGRGRATPVRLTLAGVALGAVLAGITQGITLLNPRAFDEFRAWSAGTLAGRYLDTVWQVLPFVVLGALLVAVLPRNLNGMAMGEDTATALGINVGRTRAGAVLAVTLLAGAATALAGPIAFVGLMVPHLARWLVGADQRWILAVSAVGGPMLVLLADVIGRVIIRPDEMPVSIVAAFVGAPVLIALVRRKGASGL
ncbi:FecCD family ABC transporter permease [Nakamurella aerolata]|uniref:FecCD family ABC transporter permease n=1 Tax=Nakamurella aerolata TaxID=1656892 RepID=UPI0031B56CD2